MVTEVSCCGECDEAYDWETQAEECCAPRPYWAWRCDVCYEIYEDEADAIACCPEPNEHENDC
jgi:hypothetical protein